MLSQRGGHARLTHCFEFTDKSAALPSQHYKNRDSCSAINYIDIVEWMT
jgi:hypothetical protein